MEILSRDAFYISLNESKNTALLNVNYPEKMIKKIIGNLESEDVKFTEDNLPIIEAIQKSEFLGYTRSYSITINDYTDVYWFKRNPENIKSENDYTCFGVSWIGWDNISTDEFNDEQNIFIHWMGAISSDEKGIIDIDEIDSNK